LQHHLHFLGYTRAEIVQYCVNVLIACLKDRALRSGNEDLAMGHLIVLLQYDWPNHAGLLEEMLAKIRRQGHFSYQPFVSYVIHVDVLEEFMFLANEQGNNGEVMLDIFPPSAAQLATQRRMTTRWGDKGAREDFRSAMKRQTARNNENISDLVIRFMLQERDQIIQASQ
jgi:integrator complex subunit 10